MKRDSEKARHILAEIIGYFLDHDIHQMEVLFAPEDEGCRIEVSGRTPQVPEDFEDFRRAMSDGFQPEMEEYYDGLVNIGSGKEHHYLLGTMVDRAEVTYDDGILRVKIFKRDAAR